MYICAEMKNLAVEEKKQTNESAINQKAKKTNTWKREKAKRCPVEPEYCNTSFVIGSK